MVRGPFLLCIWPGLPGLWFKGNASSLLVAIGFSILLNLALITSFIWPNSLGETFPLVAWPVILLIWPTSVWLAFQRLPDVMSVPSSEKVADPDRPDTLFIQAQQEYLGGHWDEAQRSLVRLIERNPRDIESRLMMATLFRHTRRLSDAIIQLDEIQLYDESLEWDFEIKRERALVESIAEHESEPANLDHASQQQVDEQTVND